MLKRIRQASTQELRRWLREIEGRQEWSNTEATIRDELGRRGK